MARQPYARMRVACPRLGGSTVMYFDPTSVEECILQLQRLLCDQALREKLGLAGLIRAADFSWDRSAAIHRKILTEIAQ